MARAISDEQIISAILSNSTFEAAAQACGISTRAIRERMKDPDFRADYMAAKDDILRQTVSRLNDHLTAAVDVVAEIMENKENNPATRLQAAQTVINNAAKLADHLQANEQATRQENRTLQDEISEMF